MSTKNIVFHVTKQYMKRNRRRTAITFIGIVFMVILMTCVFAGKETAMRYLQRVASFDKGSWHLIAYELTPDEAENLAAMNAVTTVGTSVPFGCMDFPQTGEPDIKPYLDVKAYSAETFEMMNITPVEGRLPENEHELIVSKNVKTDGSVLKIGDKISGECFDRTLTSTSKGETVFAADHLVLPPGETKPISPAFPFIAANKDFAENRVPNGYTGDYTVVGLMEAPYFERLSAATYTAMTLTGSESPRTVNAVIQIIPDKMDSVYDFEDEICSAAGRDIKFDTNELLLSISAKGSRDSLNGLAVFIEVFFTVLIMAASVILIYNVFNMSFAERARYLGMLSSVGATRKQKRQSVYFESFVLLIPALPVGILGGLGLISGAMHLLKPQLDQLRPICFIQF